MVDAILAASAGRAVLDVGIGTGISARPFADAGCRVLGVEPDECMAEVARRAGFEVEIATFEGWQPAGRVFDLVIAGPAWHWVDPVLGAHKAAEVLRPGGRLALFWNAFSYPPGVAAAFADLHRRLLPELPFPPSGASGEVAAYASLSERAVAGLGQRGGFGEAERWRFDWSRAYTRDEWLDTVPTFGGHGLLPSAQLDALLAGMGEVIDAAGGRFSLGYAAIVITAATVGGD